MNKPSKKGAIFKWLLPLILFALCFGLSVWTYAQYGQYNLDSDMSSDMVLAQLLNEEGHILTPNFYYSNELNLLSPVLVYQLGLRLFASWHAARTFSIGVLLLMMAVALVYMARGAGISLGAALLCAACLVLPVTGFQAFTLIYGSFYSMWAALTFLEVGLILRMKKRPLEPILLAVLGLLGGLSGVRMLMVCAAPLMAASLLTFFLEARRTEQAGEILRLPSLPLLAGSAVLSVCTYAGYLISTNILSKSYHFEQFEDTLLLKLQPDMLQDQIMALMEFFGYRAETLLLSLEGVYSLFAMVLPILGAASILLLLRMDLSARERLLALFMQVALLLGIVINVLTLYDPADSPYAYAVSYYMPAALLLVLSVFWMLDRFRCRWQVMRIVPMLVGVALFVVGFNTYRDQDVIKYEDERSQIAQLLVEEGATQGFATYWYANVLTELSDGKIEAYMVEDWDTGRVGKWLQRVDHTQKDPEGKIFAIFSAQDYENGVPGCDEEHVIYSSDKAFVCVYENVQEFYALRDS